MVCVLARYCVTHHIRLRNIVHLILIVHVVCLIDYSQRGWDIATDVKFVVKGGLTELTASVNDGSADAFIWETFMTKVRYWRDSYSKTYFLKNV